jgi:Kef-type K+ transport system membrane component KefB
VVLWEAAKRWARKAPWITFLAGTGVIVLTFLAGAELDPNVFRAK